MAPTSPDLRPPPIPTVEAPAAPAAVEHPDDDYAAQFDAFLNNNNLNAGITELANIQVPPIEAPTAPLPPDTGGSVEPGGADGLTGVLPRAQRVLDAGVPARPVGEAPPAAPPPAEQPKPPAAEQPGPNGLTAAESARFEELKKGKPGENVQEYQALAHKVENANKMKAIEEKRGRGEVLSDEDNKFLAEQGQAEAAPAAPDKPKTPEQRIADIAAENKAIQQKQMELRQQLLRGDLSDEQREEILTQLDEQREHLEENQIAQFGAEIEQMAQKGLEANKPTKAEELAMERYKEIQRLQAEQLQLVVQLTEMPRRQLRTLQEQKVAARRERDKAIKGLRQAQDAYASRKMTTTDESTLKVNYQQAVVDAGQARGRYLMACARIVNYSTSGLNDIQFRIDQLDNQIASLGGEQGFMRYAARSAINMVGRHINSLGVQTELDDEIKGAWHGASGLTQAAKEALR